MRVAPLPNSASRAQEADRLLRTNYLGAYIVGQAFLPILIKEVSAPRGPRAHKPHRALLALRRRRAGPFHTPAGWCAFLATARASQGQRKKGFDRPSIINVNSFAGKVRCGARVRSFCCLPSASPAHPSAAQSLRTVCAPHWPPPLMS